MRHCTNGQWHWGIKLERGRRYWITFRYGEVQAMGLTQILIIHIMPINSWKIVKEDETNLPLLLFSFWKVGSEVTLSGWLGYKPTINNNNDLFLCAKVGGGVGVGTVKYTKCKINKFSDFLFPVSSWWSCSTAVLGADSLVAWSANLWRSSSDSGRRKKKLDPLRSQRWVCARYVGCQI